MNTPRHQKTREKMVLKKGQTVAREGLNIQKFISHGGEKIHRNPHSNGQRVQESFRHSRFEIMI